MQGPYQHNCRQLVERRIGLDTPVNAPTIPCLLEDAGFAQCIHFALKTRWPGMEKRR